MKELLRPDEHLRATLIDRIENESGAVPLDVLEGEIARLEIYGAAPEGDPAAALPGTITATDGRSRDAYNSAQ